MIIKKWFVKLQQEEYELMVTANQLLIYLAIKSFSANGRDSVALSIRDIQKRAKVSIGTIQLVLPELIELGLLRIVGKESRRGGNVPVYKLFVPRTLDDDKRSVAEQLSDLSVQNRGLSVQSLGTNVPQLNKLNKKTNSSDDFVDFSSKDWNG